MENQTLCIEVVENGYNLRINWYENEEYKSKAYVAQTTAQVETITTLFLSGELPLD